MALTQIRFSEEEEEIIMYIRKEYSLNKEDAIKKLIRSYKNNGDIL